MSEKHRGKRISETEYRKSSLYSSRQLRSSAEYSPNSTSKSLLVEERILLRPGLAQSHLLQRAAPKIHDLSDNFSRPPTLL